MSKKKAIIDDKDAWKANLETSQIGDSDFQILVTIMDPCGASTLDQLYLEKFEKYATLEKRSVIKNISKTETIFMINQLGRDKNLKASPSHIVYEKAYEHLQENKQLSSELLALTIKQQLLMLKDHYKITQKMKTELKEGLAQESRTMLEKNALKGPASKAVSKPPDGTGDAPDEEDKKYGTSLRLRGEDWRDKVYVDDYPSDGSNLYIIITNFMDPYLPSYLIRIGIEVTAIVQIRIDPTPDTTEISPRLEPVSLFRDYWNEVQCLRTQKKFMDEYKNIIYFIFSPPHPFSPEQQVSDEPEVIYDEISFLLYDIQDVTRQHSHYLNNLEVIEVSSNVIDNLFDMYLRKRIGWPQECFTISLVLENILEVIDCWASKEKNSGDNSTKSNAKETNHDIPEINKDQGFIHKVIDTLSQESKLKNCFNALESPKVQNIVILPHYDYAKYLAYHIDPNDYLVGVTKKMLEIMPLPNLWVTFPEKSFSQQSKQNYHRNILRSCFDRDDINWIEISRWLNRLGFQKIYDLCKSKSHSYSEDEPFAEVKRKKLKRSNLVEAFPNSSTTRFGSVSSLKPIKISSSKKIIDSAGNEIDAKTEMQISRNDPNTSTIRFIFECSSIDELISPPVVEKNCETMNVIEQYEYYEDLDVSSSLQILDKCFRYFNLVSYKYCEVTDSLLIMFFNFLNENGTFNEEWTTHLNTPVCLQDFFDFVVDEHYNWIKSDDEATDKILQTHEVASSDSDTRSDHSCLDNIERGVDLLMEGSFKYAEYIEQSMAGENSRSSFQSKTPIKIKSQDGLNTCDENLSNNQDDNEEDSRIPKKSFYGFDLGDRRIEISGKNCECFTKDGSKVTVKFSTFFPSNYEFLYACIASGDRKNFIYVYNKMICNYDSSLERVIQITSADEFMINFYRTEIGLKNSFSFQSNASTVHEIHLDAVITWPNGLIIQLERDNDSGAISYVKQLYSELPMPINYMNVTENHRCINKFGETVIFFSNDTIKVLCHDGKIIFIDKYERIPISTESSQPVVISQPQPQPQPKPSKGKLLKQLTSQSLKETSSSLSFDIVFTDFSITEHDGTRNRYIGDNIQNKSRLLVRETLDVNLGEIFIRRSDDTTSYWNDEGIHIVTFPDGTRIITQYVVEDDEVFVEWTEEEIQMLLSSQNDVRLPSIVELNRGKDGSVMNQFTEGFISIYLTYITEKNNYATVISKPQENLITIENPNNTLSVLRDNEYKWVSDKSSAVITNDQLCYTYKCCPRCDHKTMCKIHLNEFSVSDPEEWILLKDLDSKIFSVSKEGIIKILTKEDHGDANDLFDDVSTQSQVSFCSCYKMSDLQKRRFFTMKRDLSVSELLSKHDVESELEKISSLPWFFLTKHNAFDGYRGLQTILSPFMCNQTQKWTMSSTFSKKPKRLTYKHLEKSCNKGFYKWMRPYKRFQTETNKLPRSTIPELPDAFIFRAYEHLFAKAENNQDAIGGEELIKAIEKYRKVIETQREVLADPNVDTRSDEEIKLDTTLQEIANQTAKEICKKLTKVKRENFVPDIRSDPIDKRSQYQEASFYTPSEVSREEDMRNLLLEAIVDKVPSNAAYNKYWAQRAADKREEAFLLSLLRNKHVPAYFSSELEFLKDN